MQLTSASIKNFWDKVDKTDPNGCWLWVGGVRSKKYPYGSVKLNKKSYLAHRVSWELSNGPIPKDLCLLHNCDISLCVNPDHLRLGTHKENTIDMVSRNRQAKGELSGNSKLNKQQIIEIRKLRKTDMKIKDIAKQFNICTRTVWYVTLGGGWNSV